MAIQHDTMYISSLWVNSYLHTKTVIQLNQSLTWTTCSIIDVILIIIKKICSGFLISLVCFMFQMSFFSVNVLNHFLSPSIVQRSDTLLKVFDNHLFHLKIHRILEGSPQYISPPNISLNMMK